MPHVIRANRNRKVPTTGPADAPLFVVDSSGSADSDRSSPHVTAEDAKLGDEFISLTFHESESSEDEGSDEEASESEAEEEPDDVDMGDI